MTQEEKTAVINDIASKVQDATKTELESIKEDLKGLDVNALKDMANKELAEKETVDNLKNQISDLSENVNFIKDNMETKENKVSLTSEIKEQKENLKSIAQGSNKTVELKALTNRAAINPNEISGLDLPGITPFGRTARTFYDFLSKQVIPLPANHGGTIRYRDWDEATTVKAASAVAEGASFPESTAKFKDYILPVEKIGDTLPVTEEFFEDEATAAAELNLFLQNNVFDKCANDVVLGDGTSPNLQSINSRALDYTAPNAGISDANIYDLTTKVVEDITTNKGSKYQPDFVLMNIADVNKLKLKKDANGNYIFDRLEEKLQPLTVLVDNHVSSNTMYVGDSRYVSVYEIPGVEVSRGLVGSQFNEDEMTIKARKRLAFLIKNGNRDGFRKVSDIGADLTTLAS